MNTSTRWGIFFQGLTVSMLAWLLLYQLQSILPWPRLQLSPGWQWGLTFVFLADGLATFIWACITLARIWRKNGFCMSGPYALLRHPMYAAILWNGTACVAFAFEAWLVLVGVVPLHLWWTYLVSKEEAVLHRKYGAMYGRYMHDVGQFYPRLSALKKSLSPPDELDED